MSRKSKIIVDKITIDPFGGAYRSRFMNLGKTKNWRFHHEPKNLKAADINWRSNNISHDKSK